MCVYSRLEFMKNGGSAPLSVLPDHDPIAEDLSVPVLLREVQAQVPGTVGIGGDVLPGGGGAANVVAGHGSVVVDLFSIRGGGGFCEPPCGRFRDRTASHPGQRCRWWHPSNGRRQGSSGPRAIPGVGSGHRRNHTGGRPYRWRSRSESRGRHSRFPSLPNR